MKEYDKNSLIGFVLMAIILIVFNTFFFPERIKEENRDEISNEISTNTTSSTKINTTHTPTSLAKENLIGEELKATYGVFAEAAIGEETFYVIENEKIKITISNKGARITSVIMKEYQTYDSLDLDLFDSDSSRFNLQLTTGKTINTSDLFFSADQRSNSLSMKLKSSEKNHPNIKLHY